MNLLTLYNEIVSKITPSSPGDRITAAELRSVLEAIRGEFLNRGVLKLADVSLLATTPNTEARVVYIERTGFFVDTATGTLVHNGVTVFTGNTPGRVWVLHQEQPLRYELTDDTDPVVVPPGQVVTMIIVTPSDESTIKAGTAAGLSDILPEDLIEAGVDHALSMVIVARTAKSIYFTGITSATKVLVYTKSL